MQLIPVTNKLLKVGYKHNANDLTSARIQLLLYFVSGWYMAMTDKPLIDCEFVKGRMIPTIPNLEERLKYFAVMPVPLGYYIKQLDPKNLRMKEFFVTEEDCPRVESIMTSVWKQYSQFTTAQLAAMTQVVGTPWHSSNSGGIISNESIANYFKGLAEKSKKARIEREQVEKALEMMA